ncbi:hypothetical protein LCGC14_2138250 [marine sediment metagenome]|uniref:Uncharacterized protein n=1 Tax=marine sediment metagenome TaxID=412755 RepID=A0A0F9DZF5_9ZZZZ
MKKKILFLIPSLEIGGGANPFINYLPESKKYVLDPLVDYYIENFKLSKGF